jgi:translation elongation factor EF-Tu-like GTPase
MYRTPLQAASVVAIIFGTYMAGAISNEEAWQAKVKELEAKVAAAEAQSAKENTKLLDKIVKRTEVIKQRGDDIIKYVDREVVKYDSQCVIPKEFIKAHNNAAEQPK